MIRTGLVRGWRLGLDALGEVRRTKSLRVAAIGLIIADLGFILLHAGHVLTNAFRWDAPFLARHRAAISYEWSYAEYFEHAKTLTAVALLLFLALYRRSVAFAIAAMVFGLVLVDNAFGLHELAGAALEWRMGDTAFHPFGLDLRVEMLAEAAVGLILFAGLGVAVFFARPRHRAAMIVLFGILVAFAVILGIAETVNGWAWAYAEWLGQTLMLIQDGLQLILFTVVALFVMVLVVRPALLATGSPPPGALADRERGPTAAG